MAHAGFQLPAEVVGAPIAAHTAALDSRNMMETAAHISGNKVRGKEELLIKQRTEG